MPMQPRETARRRLVLSVVLAVVAVNGVLLGFVLRDDNRSMLAWIGLTAMLVGLAGVLALGLIVVVRGRR